jgi:hypothetical protein
MFAKVRQTTSCILQTPPGLAACNKLQKERKFMGSDGQCSHLEETDVAYLDETVPLVMAYYTINGSLTMEAGA